jgi:phage tail sheath protein FI
MPVAPTFPGVYIEEIPSGVRTIVGVATNIAAFIGRAVAGPVNLPTVINSFADFQRQFGGLEIDYPMSYAVSDFYQNGGSQAIIVRLVGAGSQASTVTAATLQLVASSPGTWGNALQATVDNKNITEDVAARYGLTTADLFNLTVSEVKDGKPIRQERFLSLSFKPDAPGITGIGRAQRVDRVLAQSSQLVRVPLAANGDPILPPTSPATSSSSSSGPGSSSSSSSAPASSSSSSSSSSAAGPGSSSGGSSSSSSTAAEPAKASGGVDATSLTDAELIGDGDTKTGLHALDTADLFNLLCIPPDSPNGNIGSTVYAKAEEYCAKHRAFLIVDSPSAWSRNPVTAANDAVRGFDTFRTPLSGENARNAALYFPRVREADPLSNGQVKTYAPCGIIAGVMARTDVTRGVWKAPAGIDATLNGVVGLDVNLTNEENGQLNPLGINCLRSFPVVGSVVWGARTLRGADQLGDEYKYVPVRRLALFMEETLYRGTQWVVFEPNDEPLWAQIRLNVGAFMHNLFVQGAFQGQTPTDAYFVRCDKNTTTQSDINRGIVNIAVGFAPLKPAEFVILKIQQIAGSIAT